MPDFVRLFTYHFYFMNIDIEFSKKRHIRPHTVALQGQEILGQKKESTFGSVSTWISAATLTLSILSILFFSAGKAFRNAYLGVFGFTDWSMPWSVQDVVYLGAVSKLAVLLVVPFALMLMVFGCYLFLLIADVLSDFIKKYREKKFPTPSAKEEKIIDKIKADRMAIYDRLLGILLAAIIFAMMLIYPCIAYVASVERDGKERAIKLKTLILENLVGETTQDEAPFTVIKRRVQGEDVVESGYLISCTEKACAMFQRQTAGTQIFGRGKIIPLDGVTEFSGREIR